MKTAVHTIDTEMTQNKAVVETFEMNTRCFTNIKLLCQLTKAVQQHRGATMGFLSGEPAFFNQIESLQSKIDKIFLLLNHLGDCNEPIIPIDQLNNIANDWTTILIGWRDDHLLHNFEFHGHLIDTLNKLIRYCMSTYILVFLDNSDENPRHLLDTILVQLPNTTESLAKIRGLSTNVAVIKACGTESHAKISYLLKAIPEQSKQLVHSLEHLMPDITTIKDHQKEIHRFIITIEMSILNSTEITTNSSQLFAFSTEIIDAHWHVVDLGLQKIENLCYQQLLSADKS